MNAKRWSGVLLTLFTVGALLTGCDAGGHGHNKEAGATKKEAAEKKGSDHSGWWCAEHGIPEAECIMCNPKLERACKEKGDWCDKHDRAKSQCFICDPTLKEKYAAKYRAKYGKEPPPTEEEKDDKK